VSKSDNNFKQPMAEVFGHRISDFSKEAERHRNSKLCRFNNKVPNCTKDKAKDPLGVCSVFDGGHAIITCPVRFREDWVIATDAAAFFFPPTAKWTTLTEIRLKDKHGEAAGNIDVVLASYDNNGKIIDFGALEVQAVYISGNVRNPFQHYMNDPAANKNMDWTKEENFPRADFLSSSRKRLAPQLIYKGGILSAWGKKSAVALDKHFFATLPAIERVKKSEAGIAWMVYDLEPRGGKFKLTLLETVYTKFEPALLKITQSEPGKIEDFLEKLQIKLDEKLDNPPNTEVLTSLR
jgi:hypothetical protein